MEKNIYAVLKEEHREVDDLFGKIQESDSEEAIRKIFKKMMRALLLHAKAENHTFYRALEEQAETKELIDHAEDEHDKIEELLHDLHELNAIDANWQKKLEKLHEAVKHHVKEEEEKIFVKAQKILSDEKARTLCEKFLAEKENLASEVSV
jgi:hemerythrin superfamily protein